MIPEGRIQHKNTLPENDGEYVLYWMQSSQRTSFNHALAYAIDQADRLNLPLVVFFGLTDDFPEASLRHYQFMVEGLLEVKEELEVDGIRFYVHQGSPSEGAALLSKSAALLVTDRGYLRIERVWREELLLKVKCPVVQVESNVMVPADETSMKEEYSAATIRRKIERLLPQYALPLEKRTPKRSSLHLKLEGSPMIFEDLEEILSALDIRRDVPAVPEYFRGGYNEARKHLEEFIENRLVDYMTLKNDPSEEKVSNLSPYLHFGQISPLEIYLSLPDRHIESRRVFLDELITRRELAMNFVERNENYDTYLSIASFARTTLEKHKEDERPFLYTQEELEKGKTHDPYWNSAQLEMVHTGKMNGYMRMYWGKKIIEWTKTPGEAYDRAVYLNNKYSLDGRDPNGFAGIAWCFGKHDRPWKERAVFGVVRYMNAKGLERKFPMKVYVEKVNLLLEKENR